MDTAERAELPGAGVPAVEQQKVCHTLIRCSDFDARTVDDRNRRLTASGFLGVDGRIIYQMDNFVLGLDD